MLVTSVSQPLLSSMSQLPRPIPQLVEQTPATQVGAPPMLLHRCPQRPQLVMSVAVVVSQPFAALLSQSSRPGRQRATHAPPMHVTSCPGAGAAQRIPQEPQLFGSNATSPQLTWSAVISPMDASCRSEACGNAHPAAASSETRASFAQRDKNGFVMEASLLQNYRTANHQKMARRSLRPRLIML